jgi:hypothetical protein
MCLMGQEIRYLHLHPDLFPHEDGLADYFNDYDMNLPGCYSVSAGKYLVIDI